MAHEVKVLLAEDDEHIAKLIRFKLGKEGFSVSWATDGQRALSSVLSESWELIILDVMMPHLTGWQVLQAVRDARIETPVLMLTAKGEHSDLGKAKNLGATQFLKKPFDPNELVRLLRQMIPDPEMALMKAEFVASFAGRLEVLEKSLQAIDAQSSDELFSLETANGLHLVSHTLAGIAQNFGFAPLGGLASRVENELLQALGSSIGSDAVIKMIVLANELALSLRLELQGPTSCAESPASEARP